MTLRHRRPHRSRLAAGVALVAAVALGACGGSDGTDEPERAPDVTTTVVPSDPNDVDGGVPVDNLNPDIADNEFQGTDDVDGDGNPEP